MKTFEEACAAVFCRQIKTDEQEKIAVSSLLEAQARFAEITKHAVTSEEADGLVKFLNRLFTKTRNFRSTWR